MQKTNSASLEQGATRTEILERRLADLILSGDFPPGAALDETELARKFEVSRTPVREALRLLAASGLVQHRRHLGAVVARPSDEELLGMFFVMGELEALCATIAASAMTSAERSKLEALHQTMAGLVRAGDVAAYSIANATFHELIYRGSHNAYLGDITMQTRRRLAPFRKAQFSNLGRLVGSHAEHSDIVTALLRGESRRASDLMRAHLATVGASFVQYRP